MPACPCQALAQKKLIFKTHLKSLLRKRFNFTLLNTGDTYIYLLIVAILELAILNALHQILKPKI